MRIESHKRNIFWRTAHPGDTTTRIREGIKKLNLNSEIKFSSNGPDMWSARLKVPEIKAASNGKGTSQLIAEASAYAEFAERFSAGLETGLELGPYRQWFGHKGELLSDITTYKYMEGYRWLHQDCFQNVVKVEDLLRENPFTKDQLEHLKLSSEFLKHWIPGYSLTKQELVYVPILFVKWISSTNGLASGNILEEALIQASCEIFERDALIKFLSFANKKESLTIDHNSIDDPTIHSMIDYLNSMGVDSVIKYIGQDIYPVYALITFNKNKTGNQAHYSTIKAGCSFDPIEAITRCFTERMQGTSIGMEMADERYIDASDPNKYLQIFFKGISHVNLTNHAKGPIVPLNAAAINDTKVELEQCLSIAQQLDTDLIFIDHTHPVLNFPVVRVVMPGVSDFIKWWNPQSVTLDLLGNLDRSEDRYEEKLVEVIKTFKLRR